MHRVCPDCPLLIPLNDSRVTHAADAALAAFNAQNNGAYYQLMEVARAQFVVKTETLWTDLGSLVAFGKCLWQRSEG